MKQPNRGESMMNRRFQKLHFGPKPISILLLFIALFSYSQRNESLNPESLPIFIKGLYSLPRNLDPIKANDTASLLVSQLLYSGLLKFENDLSYSPDLAESWELDQAGTTYTFKLRKNISFHNGMPITANDVTKSLERALSKASVVYKYYECIEGAKEFYQGKSIEVKGIKVITPDMLQIKLTNPFPPFLSVLAGATAKVLPINNIQSDPLFFEHPIGSGPFRFLKMIKTTNDYGEMELESFQQTSADSPHIKKLRLLALTESEALKLATEGKIHDLSNFPLSGSEAAFKVGKKIDSPVAATWIIGLNTRIAPFDKLSVRQAFKFSVPTEKFRNKFYNDSIPAYGYIPIGLPGHISAPPESLQPAKAPKHTEIKIAIPSVLSKHKEMIDFFHSELRPLGWNVTFVPMGWDELMKGYDEKSLQGFLVSMNMDYPETEFLIRNFESNNPDNFSGLNNPQIDLMIQKARLVTDKIQRTKFYQEVLNKIEEQAVTINLFHPRSHFWIHTCVTGFLPNILSDYYIDFRKVGLDANCLQAANP